MSFTQKIFAQTFLQSQYRMAGVLPPPMPWYWKKEGTHYITNVGILLVVITLLLYCSADVCK
jgi:hypothetical protein